MLAAQVNSALLNGVIPLAFGVYTSLLGYGIFPYHPGNPNKSSAWRARWGAQAKIAGPLLVLYGLFMTARALFF